VRLRNDKRIIGAFAEQNISLDEITYEQLQEAVASVVIYFADIKHTSIKQNEARTVRVRVSNYYGVNIFNFSFYFQLT
jgi:hypothetical protein